MYEIKWDKAHEQTPRSYKCSWCAKAVASARGWSGELKGEPNNPRGWLYICPSCTYPTLFVGDIQSPGAKMGDDVTDVSSDHVATLYDEARRAAAAGCHSAAVMCCRKLLMHIGVANGAKTDESFKYYVQFLVDEHFVPKIAQDWVVHIKDVDNIANHDIKIHTAEDSEDLLTFVAMLLKMIYEYPARVVARPAVKTKPDQSP